MSATGSGPPTGSSPPPPTPPPEPVATIMTGLAGPPSTPTPTDLDAGIGSSPLSPSPGESESGQAYVTATDSSAAQLLSSAFPDGLPNAYNPDQGGWSTAVQISDAYTGLTGVGAGNPFTGGSDVDPFTGLASGDGNQNGFTGGSNIDPYGGVQNSEPSTGGSLPAASGTQDLDLASLYGGPTSLLSSPDLLATNDVTTPAANAVASDASGAGFSPQISDTASDTGGSTYIGTIVDNGVAYYQFADIGGTVYEMRADTDTTPAPAPAGTPPTGGTGTYSPAPTPPTAAADVPPPAASVPPPTPDPAPISAAAAPPTQQAAPDPASLPPTPTAAPPASPPDPAQSQPPQSQPAPQAGQTASPPPSPPPQQTPAVPFDPMADSPFAKWLLYGNDTPVRDFLTNDKNLQTAQLAAGAVAIAAATVATGGVASELAGGYLTGAGATALETSVLSGAAGSVAGGATFRYGVAAVAGTLGAPVDIGTAARSAFDPTAMATDALTGAVAGFGAYGGARLGQYWASRSPGVPASGAGDLPSLPTQGQAGGRPIAQGPPQTFVTSTESAGGLPAAPPDPAAVSSGSHYYYADQSGRALGAEGWVYTQPGSARAAGSAAVQQATTGGATGLHGAHLYADSLGGAPVGANMVPFSAEANLSSMKVVENAVRDYSASGRDIYLQVSALYADQGAIPATVTYRVWTPGPTGELGLIDQFTVDLENNLVWTEPPPPGPTVH